MLINYNWISKSKRRLLLFVRVCLELIWNHFFGIRPSSISINK